MKDSIRFDKNLFIQAWLTWVLFIPIAIVNGMIRERLYKPYIGDLAAHQLSTIILCILFFMLVFLLLRKRLQNTETVQLLLLGMFWLFMTMIFEGIFGYFVEHVSLERLLAEYNIFQGRIWSLVLLTEFFTPVWIRNIQKMNGAI